MRRLLSKEGFADFAQQAAGALRRMVSSADGWNSRDALSASSQVVVAACKTNTRLDAQTLRTWVDDLVQELERQSSAAAAASGTPATPAADGKPEQPTTAEPQPAAAAAPTPSEPASDAKAKPDTWKPLSESALMANLEVARALMFGVNVNEAGAAYHEKNLVAALVHYYSNPALTQKLRDCCALVVVGVCSSQRELLRDCLRVSGDTLRSTSTDYTSGVLRVLLASLLVEVLHQFHISGYRKERAELDERGMTYCKGLINSLFHAACQLMQEPTPPSTSGVVSPISVVNKGEGNGGGAAAAAATATPPSAPAEAATQRASPTSASAFSPSPNTTAAAASTQPAHPAELSSSGHNTTNPAIGGAPAPADTQTVPANGGGGGGVIGGSIGGADAAAPAVGPHPSVGGGATSSSSLTFASSVVFLAVIGGIYRDVPALKTYFLQTYGAEYAQLWSRLATQLPQMQTTLQLPLASSSSSSRAAIVTATLEPVEYWRSELLESLVELCTDDSFTNQRAVAMMALHTGSGTSAAAAAVAAQGNSARRIAQRSAGGGGGGSGGGASSAAGAYEYDPIPTDWEVYLSSGTVSVWRLASALYVCTITADGADVLKVVLLQLNTKYASAETLFRWIICTLTLLCVANPRNAVLLSEHHMLRTLIALINCDQPSVFPSSEEVTLWSCGGEAATTFPSDPAPTPQQVTLTLTPQNTLNVNTTQLTFCFLDTLTSSTFSKSAVEMLRNGIKDMYAVASSQTDVDVVENVLYGMCKAFMPHPLLFFPGDGYVTWRLKQMFPRGSGYSFSAWVFPTCVWGGGSCLYSFIDQSDTRVSILLVADGRLCSLAVRVNKAGSDPLELVMSDGTFAASQWTHVVVTQGVALNVYINGRRLESVHDVPYPKEKHALTFTMGGAAQLPGFFGYTAGMNISATLSEKDVARLHAAGPMLYEPTKDCASVLAPCFVEESSSEGQPPSAAATLQRHEVLAKRASEFSWHHVEVYTPTDIAETITPKRVLEWVLSVLKARATAPIQSTSTFMNVAKLCVSFVAAAMQLAGNDDLTTLVRKNYLERLRAEVLSWSTTFPEFASLLLQSMTVRGGGRMLRQHACTQCVFDILLSCVMQTSARNKELMERLANASGDHATPSSRSGGSTPSPSPSPSPPPPLPVQQTIDAQETNSTNIILRELSDCLLVKENLKLFQEDPRRFQNILNLSLYLPKECIKSIVILIEKLCRGEAELRRVFLFLFTPSTLSPTADTAKVRVLRMLFDIAQEDIAMCEMIQECFKGRGFAFVLLLVNGENHSSEAIRVLAIGLLSLLMPLKSCAKFFKKNDGFDILSMAITEPRHPIPLGIRTFDALIQVAFDEFRRRKEKKPEADSIAMRLMAAAHLAHRSKQRDPNSASSSSAAASAAAATAATPAAAAAASPTPARPPRRTFEYRGHTPTITVNQLGTRRGYSFEHTHDYGKVNEDFGELMILHKGSRYHSLELPLALKAVLCALDSLIRSLVTRLPSPSITANPSGVNRVSSGEQSGGAATTTTATAGVAEYPVSPLPRQESGMFVNGAASAAAASSLNDEHVVIEVLNYLSKVIDYPKHALKLMDIQWLGGLWVAVRVFFEKPSESAGPGGASPPPAPEGRDGAASLPAEREAFECGVRRLHQDRIDFVNEVKQRSCTIIRKMVILDISSNERAQVRSIRDGDYPPRLVRIVLEEIARYFCVQKNGELGDSASNIIRNLNSLFKDVQTALNPFPPSLGVAIVMAITNISVSSSMQVRRRMKNSSNLLTIRDNLAFFVLRESRRFLRLRKRSLNQLIDINVNNANSMTVLLFHLSNSIRDNNVNEVEVLVSLIQQLAGADPARVRELHNVVGESRDVIQLKELLSSSSSGGVMGSTLSPLQPAAYPSMPTPSDRAMSEAFTDVDSNAGGVAGGAERPHWSAGHGLGLNPLEDDSEPSPGAFTVQLLEWCQSYPEAWAGVQKNIQAAMTSLALDKKDEKREDKKEERGAFFGGVSGSGQSPKAGSSGGAASVGYSERSRREFQQLRTDVEEELSKGSGAPVAAATPRSSVGH